MRFLGSIRRTLTLRLRLARYLTCATLPLPEYTTMRGSILLVFALCCLSFLAGVGFHSRLHPDVPPPGISYDSTRVLPEPARDPIQPKAIVLYRTIRDTIFVRVPVPVADTMVYAISSKAPTISQHGRTVTLSPMFLPDSLRYVSYTFPISRPAWSWGLYATARHDVMGNALGLTAHVRFKRVSLFAGASAYPDHVAPLWGLQVRLAGSP